MGGMQALQLGVSHPDMMDSVVAIVPLACVPNSTLRINCEAQALSNWQPCGNW
jgi:homoserine acetyltransferase